MRPYSDDLRVLFCRYLDEGLSSRAAGRVVGISASTAVKWARRRRVTGSVAANKVGGGKPVLLGAERDWLMARIDQKKDLTLHELLAELRDERGVVVCCDTLWRFLKRCGKTFKKNDLRQGTGSTRRRPPPQSLALGPALGRPQAHGLY